MTLMDKACYERGCAHYDYRDKEHTVKVALRNDVLEEVAKEIEKMTVFGKDTIGSFTVYIRSMKHD